MSADTPLDNFTKRFTLLRDAINFNGCRHRGSRYPNWLLDNPPRHPYLFWLEELFDMPAKSKSKKPGIFAQMTFVNFKFDKETKEAFLAWYTAKNSTFVADMFATLQADNKLSVSWDSEKECFTAAMTGKADSLNPDKCLTVKSDDWAKALAACVYVHTVVFDGEIWDVDNSTDMV